VTDQIAEPEPGAPDMAARMNALRCARHCLGTADDAAVDDLIAVADWLLTGQPTIATALAAQRARDYTAQHAAQLSPDAMSWLAPRPAETET